MYEGDTCSMMADYNAWMNRKLHGLAAEIRTPGASGTWAPSSIPCTARSMTCPISMGHYRRSSV